MAPARDYYADLELPPSADIKEVKKQFRKLALQYHPDRNPGREHEVNAKFQTIQSAHEVLSDPQQKAKYDAILGRSSRYPAASGVKGNPWQNVGQQFPTPPRRNTAARNATSGAQRWQSRFSHGVPPTAKQQAAADHEAKKNAARAFESMRKTQSQGSTASQQREAQQSQPPPPPPRTESARQRAQASFGARKTGLHPRSAVPSDEPPVQSRNYWTRRGSTERPQAPEPPPRPAQTATVPDPLSQFRDRDSYADRSTPYSSHGGEKTDPFDGVPLARAKSTREAYRRDEPPASDEAFVPEQDKNRSSSVPKSADMDAAPGNDEPLGSPANAKSDNEEAHNLTAHVHADQGPSTENQPTSEQGSGDGPSMYEPPCNEQSFMRSAFAAYSTIRRANLHSGRLFHQGRLDPSGDQKTPNFLYPFEKQQRQILDDLISNVGAGVPPERERAFYPYSTPGNHGGMALADRCRAHSFNFSARDAAFEQTSTSADPSRFTKTSVDDINTSFVDDDGSKTWQFSAGDAEQGGQPANRRSPLRRMTMQRTESTDRQPQTEAHPGGFSADGWSDKFGPQTFAPPPPSGPSTSPTRSSRPNPKKSRAKATAGTAAIVEDDSSSDEEMYAWRGRNAQAKPASVDSPQAMDIDSPPSVPAEPPQQPSSARNIPVEPSRPEWRPGNVDSVTTGDAKPERPEKVPMGSNAAGSEDTDEFRTNFLDLKNVGPFVQQKAGLASFTDLKDNLPFESKASDVLPIKLPKAQPLVFPTPPEAPRLPPTMAVAGLKPNAASWVKYLADFESYLQQWDEFNGQVVDHFATRKAHIARIRSSKGYSFLGVRADGDIQEYFNWVQQDNDVRQRWNSACEEHEKRFREFVTFREKMKGDH